MRTAREILDEIDALFAEAEAAPSDVFPDVRTAEQEAVIREAQRLAHVLAALRGSDSGDEELKMRTTARIRAAAFPKTAALVRARGGTSSRTVGFIAESDRIVISADRTGRIDHFNAHAELAARALGLSIEAKAE